MEYELARGRHASRRSRSRTSTRAWASSGRRRSSRSVDLDLRHRRLPGDHGLDRRRRAGSRTATREEATKAHRILADHGRGMTFLVGDGVMPSNEGRGYVLRRIIRRAVQQARTIGLDDLWRITDIVVEQMGPWYPELRRAPRARSSEIVQAEEERFSRDARARAQGVRGGRRARARSSGEDAFTLAATYGFPIELTRRARRRARPGRRRGRASRG